MKNTNICRTGGVVALGLSVGGWTLNDCEQYLCTLFNEIFATPNVHRFATLKRTSHPRYRSNALEDAMHAMFSEQRIADLARTNHPIHQSTKVAVLISSAYVFSRVRIVLYLIAL
jgi:hypothetical protein